MNTNIISWKLFCRVNKIASGRSSMSKKSAVVGAKSSKDNNVQIPIKGPVTETKQGHFSICIQVKPGAKVDAVTGMSEDAVSLQIAAPPVDGEANVAIIKYISQILNLKKALVSLKGGKSRQKIVTVDSSSGLSVENIVENLKKQMD